MISARCGMKDIDNALLPQCQPGPMEVFSGVEVEEYYALDQPIGITGNWFKGESRIWAERLNTRDDKTTAIIARYNASNGWLDNQVAITVKGYGSGLVYYVGAYLDDMAQEALIERFLRTATIKPMMITPKGVEVCKRVNLNGEQFLIIINHNPIELKVPFPCWKSS